MTPPTVLLPYQVRLLQATSDRASGVVVCEKSRRIGMTWAIGADAVLSAAATKGAGGSDVFYIGYNLDMTREFVDTCAMWAKSFHGVAVEIGEFLFHDRDEGGGGEDRAIKAFRITFASGFEIIALCSRPRSLRGRQGYVIIDEAAFHDELEELLKAALALLIWGGRVLVISTHNGAENAFNQLLEDCRAGRKRYAVVRTTFDEAIADGLYQRVCLSRGLEWTADSEAAWAASIRSDYGDAASEELDCVPRASGGKYLARTLLEARATPAPVLHFACDDKFVDLAEHVRQAAVEDWLEREVLPLARAISGGRTFLGQDFGRSGDLSVQWPLVLSADLHRHTPFVLELRNVPFRQQEQILFALIDALPQFSGGAFDARGNGQYLAEVARQRYGPECIAEVMFTEGWYREHMPPMKAALEDDALDLPRSAGIIDDFRALEVVNGVARIVERTTSADGGKRHGDSAIACALAFFASRTLDAGPFWVAGRANDTSRGAFADLPSVSGFKDKMGGWN